MHASLRPSVPEPAVVFLADTNLLKAVADLRWRLDELLSDGRCSIVVDITGLTKLSSPTLAALLWAQRRCRARGGRVTLVNPSRRARMTLARTGTASLFSDVDLDSSIDSWSAAEVSTVRHSREGFGREQPALRR